MHFGVNETDIHQAIREYSPDNNRSQIKKTERNVLIMDAYNANPTSLQYALEGLSKQDEKDKYFVIGDMLELGESGKAEHRNILEVATNLGLKGIIVGPLFSELAGEFSFPAFQNAPEARKYLEKENLTGQIILVKGSRGIKLEEVVTAL